MAYTALPVNAGRFVSFMEYVWAEHNVEQTPAGGMIVYTSSLYDQYHDALTTAKLCGMVRTGGTRVNGNDWHVYRFPNANDGVRIARDGNAIEYTAHRFGKKS